MIRLNRNEHSIMNALWEKPNLTWAEINQAAREAGAMYWNERSSFYMLDNLVKKGLLEMSGVRQMHTKLSRTYAPTIKKVDYYAELLATELQADEIKACCTAAAARLRGH